MGEKLTFSSVIWKEDGWYVSVHPGRQVVKALSKAGVLIVLLQNQFTSKLMFKSHPPHFKVLFAHTKWAT